MSIYSENPQNTPTLKLDFTVLWENESSVERFSDFS